MYLIQQTFRVKYGQMDRVLKALRTAADADATSALTTRVMTDMTGDNFTLVIESRADSIDDYFEKLWASFSNPALQEAMAAIGDGFEAGSRRIFKIEWEA